MSKRLIWEWIQPWNMPLARSVCMQKITVLICSLAYQNPSLDAAQEASRLVAADILETKSAFKAFALDRNEAMIQIEHWLTLLLNEFLSKKDKLRLELGKKWRMKELAG